MTGSDIGVSRYPARQGSRRRDHFGRVDRFGASQARERAGEEQDPPNDSHHWLQVRYAW
jgi:hypothetical protein